MLKRPRFQTFNDGVARVLTETDARHVKGINPATTDGLKELVSLAFQSKTNRQQDVELADAQGFSLSRKILVRSMPLLSTLCLVEIAGVVYEVGYIDRAGMFAFLYLDSIEVDGQISLVKTTVSKTPLGVSKPAEEIAPAWCRKRSWRRERSVSVGSDRLSLAAAFTVRAEDWDEQSLVRLGEKQYTVVSVASKGRWVEIEAERKAGDR